MRLVDTPPAFCSGCFQSKPEQRHVDFDVAWDGPVLQEGLRTGDGETVHTVAVSIDDLVLCEECLSAAAARIGMIVPDAQTAELEQLQDANRNLAERYRGLEEYAARLEEAVNVRPERPRQPSRKAAKAAA